MTVAERIEACGYENVLVFESPAFEEAFIGISEDGRAVYAYESMVESLVKTMA